MIKQISNVHESTDFSIHPDTLWVRVQFKEKFIEFAIADVDNIQEQVKAAHKLLDKAIDKLEVLDTPHQPQRGGNR